MYIAICPRCGSIEFNEYCTDKYSIWYGENGVESQLINTYDCDYIECANCNLEWYEEIDIPDDKYREIIRIEDNSRRLVEFVKYLGDLVLNKYEELSTGDLTQYVSYLCTVIEKRDFNDPVENAIRFAYTYLREVLNNSEIVEKIRNEDPYIIEHINSVLNSFEDWLRKRRNENNSQEVEDDEE